MVKIVSIKFKDGGKPYFFAPNGEQLEKGDGVVVETAKGQEYAVVDEAEKEVEDNQVVQPLKPVIRKATEKDLAVVKRNEERKGEAIKIFREKVDARQLGMKPIGCEFAFDQSKVTFYFTAESRVDFRELIRDLSYAFHMRIELRQVGIRDEIKIMGGIGPCGRECCCMKALHEPKKVSVKMAKTQNLSLNPEKISGLCGRLMCCLSYENDFYAEVAKQMPKIGGSADTPDGKGTVINVNMFNMTVKVKIVKGEDIAFKDYPLDSIAFMKGNVLYGKVAPKEEKPELDIMAPGAAGEEAEPKSAELERQGKNRDKNREKRSGRDKNREGGKGERPDCNKNRNQGGGEGSGQNANKKNKNFKQNNNRPHGQNGGDDSRKNGANPNAEKRETTGDAQGRENAFKEGRRSRKRHRGGRGNENGNNNNHVESNE